eukprot:CAMPEP_0202442798 /NCGR_PEP_ID=MMETSP1360-20130828/2158_1 /ASSEMBLY_ACC=CAM_ASM_000848 /TAXON_ID=515479 /ORGANISM="Licmophora paradoxa, Strain CCMP2313" /LENGTH=125 /DNA_ID=CAMNT_0049058251 /DNA_START=23 /DNA_END=400 /DNA_ORIENTATION=+
MISRFFLPLLCLTGVASFVVQPSPRTSTFLKDATGGWGATNSRKLSDLEKAGNKRRSFEKYEAQDNGEFLRQLEEERTKMSEEDKKELLACAAFAGIDFQDPGDFKFEPEDLEEDDLDVSVQFDE